MQYTINGRNIEARGPFGLHREIPGEEGIEYIHVDPDSLIGLVNAMSPGKAIVSLSELREDLMEQLARNYTSIPRPEKTNLFTQYPIPPKFTEPRAEIENTLNLTERLIESIAI